MSITHPYYPKNAILSGNVFTPNTWSVTQLITTFALCWTALLVSTLVFVRTTNKNLKISDQALILWFVLTGSIHIIFEGYFITHHHDIASRTSFFAQLWKEYALSDSRYMTSDAFLLSIETWTVLLIGPLSLLTAYSITTTSPYRHQLQSLVSTMHCYGNILYFSTSLLEETRSGGSVVYYRPEWVYFWVYFVGMNGIWFVVPGYCLYQSIQATATSFQSQKAPEKAIKSNGYIKTA